MNRNPTFSSLLSNPVHLLAFGFGTGLAPKAPGTFGTLVGIPLFLLVSGLPWWAYLATLLVTFVAGIYICGRTARDLGVHDHGGIVWDEVVGYLVTVAFVVPGPWTIMGGFVLFRLFDIWKPWPIGWADRKVSGGLGIMLDDVLAGLYGAAALYGLTLLVGQFG